jgi:LacI family gluconate utilization system Gnt-I transcriptional repressor
VTEKKPRTLKDVSAAANLSLITVSRALRKPETVRPETRAKVQEAIKQVGYVPNLTARSLVSNRSNMVGLVVPFLRSSLFADLAEGLTEVLTQHDRQLLLGVSNRSIEQEYGAVRTFLGRQADAIVVTGFTHNEACQNLLRSFHGPVVETWNLKPEAMDLAVGFDNKRAAMKMTRYLIKGHRSIAVVGGDFDNNDQAADRYAGFVEVMREEGLEIPPEHVIEIPNPTTVQSGRDALHKLMSSADKPTAIFFHAELPAHGAIMACLSEGIRVPQDIAIAGFGDLSLSEMLPVPLTTVKVDAVGIGRRTGALIIDRLDGKMEEEPLVDVGFELMVRDSA